MFCYGGAEESQKQLSGLRPAIGPVPMGNFDQRPTGPPKSVLEPFVTAFARLTAQRLKKSTLLEIAPRPERVLPRQVQRPIPHVQVGLSKPTAPPMKSLLMVILPSNKDSICKP